MEDRYNETFTHLQNAVEHVGLSSSDAMKELEAALSVLKDVESLLPDCKERDFVKSKVADVKKCMINLNSITTIHAFDADPRMVAFAQQRVQDISNDILNINFDDLKKFGYTETAPPEDIVEEGRFIDTKLNVF